MALSLAENGIYSTKPNPRVGCVLVKDNELLGQGWHSRAGSPHAEIIALQDASNKSPANLTGATAYVTLEPCCHQGKTAPCVDALIAAKIDEIYISMKDPNPLVNGQGISKLSSAGIKVHVGLLEEEARHLNRGFIHRHINKKPWITVKIAQSLDGVMVLNNSMSSSPRQWITGEASRRDVHLWRARSCAVLSGANSISTDNSRLNVRLDSDSALSPKDQQQLKSYVSPLRIALDPRFSLEPHLDFFTTAGPKLWVGTDSYKPPQNLPKDTDILTLPTQRQTNGGISINIADLLVKLSEREINELLVESGPRLTNSFLIEGLVDEMMIYLSPKMLRAKAATNNDMIFNSLDNVTYKFDFIKEQLFGEDLRLTLKPNYQVN